MGVLFREEFFLLFGGEGMWVGMYSEGWGRRRRVFRGR